MISAGADVKSPDETGATSLVFAALYAGPEFLRVLLDPPEPWISKRLDGLRTNRLYDLAADGKRILGMFAPDDGDGEASRNTDVTVLFNLADELRRRVPLS